MKGRYTNRERKRRTDFPFNFYIVDFRDSFWGEKNARLERDFNSLAPFS